MKKNVLLLLLFVIMPTTFCEFSWEKVVMVGSAISFLRFAPVTVQAIRSEGIINGGFSSDLRDKTFLLIPRLIIDGMVIKAMWDGIGKSRISKAHFIFCFIGSAASCTLKLSPLIKDIWDGYGLGSMKPFTSVQNVQTLSFMGLDALTAAVCAKNLFSVLR